MMGNRLMKRYSPVIHQGYADQIAMRYHFMFTKISKINFKKTKMVARMKRTGTLIHC